MKNIALIGFGFLLAGIVPSTLLALEKDKEEPAEKEAKSYEDIEAKTFAGLKARLIGPALMSGRICDFAVDPDNHARYFVAVCSGGVWKTENAGTTWTPIFDDQGSYSIGCITMDPNNPDVIWVGTGENNSQRSVSFGDGVYKSLDGGKSWQNMGLKQSEHIGMIVVDPRDSDVVYVAAQGPLWKAGGDRGLYKTTDGGKSWERILYISEHTGINEVHMDPRDPDVLYASSYQRRRRVWTLINGGPESDIYKSTDAGRTWRKITKGIPDVDKGRIGMCVSPADPDVVYAIIEAQFDKGGVFRSTDRGETWSKRSGYMASSPQYYNEIVCDPIEVDRVYSLDTFMHVTEDGGKTFKRAPREFRHVDDHAMWINPKNNDHMLVGSDGGIYESYDRGENWHFKDNLPITQFYRITVDNSEPFYYVYGGTQDNNTQGGPSRTRDPGGIKNEDWFITVGGDGYETVVDPTDPMIVYSQWQYGGLVRHDRRSGEIVDIKPREAPGEEPYRWNWDSPLILSPHNHKRLYFAANKLFRSNDRGNSWEVISGDLSRGIDRNKLEVMDRVWSIDAVSKNQSTSFYGNAVSLTESPLVEGLIYVGTDDGLIHVTEDGGENWRTIGLFPGIPDMTYVSELEASVHDPDTVFAGFDNHKNGDFKPYLLKSTDRGQTWESITGNLPERDIVYTMGQDHERADLLFVGTEFGAYFTLDGGEHWFKINGIPTIAVRDLDIQRRENDVAFATFGRSFYILDDYSPLRHVTPELLDEGAFVFPTRPSLRYIEDSRLGSSSGRGSQGASFYIAPNPPFGAVFTYYLKEKPKTMQEKRREREEKLQKKGKPIPYPTDEEIRAEDEEHKPQLLLIVRDQTGRIMRRITGSRSEGMHRAAWDLRHPSTNPTRLQPPANLPPWVRPPAGPLALPGTYTVTLALEHNGQLEELTEPQECEVVDLDLATFAAEDKDAAMAFKQKVNELHRAVRGALRAADEAEERLKYLRKAFMDTPDADPALLARMREHELTLNDLLRKLRGDRALARHAMPTPPSILSRVQQMVGSLWYSTAAPTQTQQKGYDYAATEFEEVLPALRKLIEEDIAGLEAEMEEARAPWTPHRVPEWRRK